ncbi:MBL fold metallo-hydrolase [Desulfosporosinus sp. SB140]|uniref:MBL fold metallo-hydrolase n=1 Tax=Desulfosporosinus paludis TaxID=3115649 RepID=UPI00388EF582
MNLRVLGSSSEGNCYLLQTDTDTLILDCGVKFKGVRIALDFDLRRIKGCLITHEHHDHSKGVIPALKLGVDVFMSKGTSEAIGVEHHRLNIIKAGEQFVVGDFIVLPFPTEHDASEPFGYLIQYKPTGEKLIFATDTYYINNRFKGLDYILCECNYCKDTLDANIETGYIPQGMKNRLLESHFSLEHVKEFLAANDLSKIKVIVLLHLSDANSDVKRMIREIEELTGKIVVVADAGKDIPLELYPF